MSEEKNAHPLLDVIMTGLSAALAISSVFDKDNFDMTSYSKPDYLKKSYSKDNDDDDDSHEIRDMINF